jgi:hypothetical protein
MAERNENARLERECRVFGRYLLSQDMNPYILKKYVQAHGILSWKGAPGFFDPLLVKIATWHPLATKICDAYARFFSPRGVLRKKLVLLLSLLELTPPYFQRIDAADGGSRLRLFAVIVWKGATMVFSLLLSVFILLPLQLLSKIIGGKRFTEGKSV